MVQIVNEAAAIAVIAFTYAVILVEPEEILERFYKLIYKLANKTKSECEPPKFRWWFKPVIDCEKCVAGQIALWYYLIKYRSAYNFIDHLLLICTSIFIVTFIKLIYKWIQRH